MPDALGWLLTQQSQMTSELEQLCNLNSGSESLPGLDTVSDWLVEYFAPLESPVVKIDLPPYESIDDQGTISSYATGKALRWNLASSTAPNKKRILLSIHYDTVYGPTNPFQSCYQYEAKNESGHLERRMRGPGVIDAKGGIVVLRWACMAVKRYCNLTNVDLSIILTPDEEIGSPASRMLWTQVANQFDFALLFEPALPDGSLVSERKGTGTFVVVVRGKSAHSGRNFHDGRNALVRACQIANEFDALNGIRPNVTVNVGRLRSGDAVNVVPDLAVLRTNVRVSDDEDQKWIEAQVQSIVHKYHQPNEGFQVELSGGIHAPPKVVDEEVARWMTWAEEVGKSIGDSIRWKASGGASDGNKLSGLGLPNIDTFGPEGDLLHSDQEWIRLSSLPRKAALTSLLIDKIAAEMPLEAAST